MKKVTLNEMNLLDLGNTIQVAGVVYAGKDDIYVCMLPEESVDDREVHQLDLSHEDWKRVIRQTDIMETEILTQAEDGKLVKAIVRKSTRQIEQGVSWAVYRRDNFRCRYCAADKVPMTVDHLVLWEEGGPSIEENLVTCCRRCNKTRGDTPYAEWLESPYYKKVSRRLLSMVREDNLALVDKLVDIPLRVHVRGR